MKTHWMLFAVVSVCLSLGLSIKADPVYFAGTGHYYELVEGVYADLNWDIAKSNAEDRTYLGESGYLATVTSDEETSFLVTNFLESAVGGIYIIGGYQPDGSPEPDGNWQWVTGEPWIYTNWDTGEPNDAGDEDTLHLYGQLYASGTLNGKWNDQHHTGGGNGYIVEYTPEPATLGLLLMGGLVLLQRNRSSF